MQRDADFLASLFVEDAEFVNVVGLWWHNRDDIRKAHAYGFEKIFPDSDLDLRKTTVKYLADDIAVVHARMRLKNQTPADKESIPSLRQNIFSFVVQKKRDIGCVFRPTIQILCPALRPTYMPPMVGLGRLVIGMGRF